MPLTTSDREDRRRVDCEVDLDRVVISARDEPDERLVLTNRLDIPTCSGERRAEGCRERADISGWVTSARRDERVEISRRAIDHAESDECRSSGQCEARRLRKPEQDPCHLLL